MAIFISYRRRDTDVYVKRIRDVLVGAFGRHYVFLDETSIKPGDPFPDRIKRGIQRARVVVVAIGKNWLPKGHLLDEDDWVRKELVLVRDNKHARCLLVTIDGAALPAVTSVPEGVRPLLTINALPLDTGPGFATGAATLVRLCRERVLTRRERSARRLLMASAFVGAATVTFAAVRAYVGPRHDHLSWLWTELIPELRYLISADSDIGSARKFLSLVPDTPAEFCEQLRDVDRSFVTYNSALEKFRVKAHEYESQLSDLASREPLVAVEGRRALNAVRERLKRHKLPDLSRETNLREGYQAVIRYLDDYHNEQRNRLEAVTEPLDRLHQHLVAVSAGRLPTCPPTERHF